MPRLDLSTLVNRSPPQGAKLISPETPATAESPRSPTAVHDSKSMRAITPSKAASAVLEAARDSYVVKFALAVKMMTENATAAMIETRKRYIYCLICRTASYH